METSTPMQYRVRPLLELEQSPVDLEQMETSGQGSSDGSSEIQQNRLRSPTIQKNMEGLKMTPSKPEEPTLARARMNVTAIEHGNSHESFRVRSLSLSHSVTGNIIKDSKMDKNISGSVGKLVFSDGVDEKYFIHASQEDSVKNDRCYLEPWVIDYGTFGLESLFIDDEEREDIVVNDLVQDITKNKLYDIFIKTCTKPLPKYRAYNQKTKGVAGVLVTPGKRKTSFLPDLVNTRPTKTACCQGDGARTRAQSVVGCILNARGNNNNRSKQRPRAMSISGQQLLTRWYSKK